MFAGQTASKTRVLKYPAHLCLAIRPTAHTSSKTPLSRMRKLCSGSHGGISQRYAAGFTKCRTPLAKNRAASRKIRALFTELDFNL